MKTVSKTSYYCSANGSRLRPKVLALAVAACFSSTAWANPSNPTVVHGTATFQQAGNILNVTNSNNAIINWGSFSIGVNELTRFIQPSALSAVLNRVTGGDPSAILGALQSNGRVFLLNPNGIMFGAGSQINVAGLVASTLNLSNADFLAGRMNFTDGAGVGSVINQGSINAAGGPVYLVGNAVTNQGIITSPGGEVILAAGNSVELVNPGTPNLRVEIQAANNEARNLGSVVAEAGRIGIYAGLIKQGGVINADSVVAEGGRIMLRATRNITLEQESVISAKGVGGGNIVVLADDTTKVAGVLDASAPNGGNGGFIETSGKIRVQVDDGTRVTTSAPAGKTGVWLIDPADLLIAASGGDMTGASIATNLATTDVTLTSDNGGTSGNGDIFVNDSISWNSGNSLTLTARRNVTVNSAISNAGTGGINLYAGWDGSSSPSSPTLSNLGMIALNNSISTAGIIKLGAKADITQSAAGVISAAQLKAVSLVAPVTLNAATNNVGIIAGSAIGQFAFSNSSASNLAVGSVGGVDGITVDNRTVFGGPNASINLTQNGGGQLMVGQPVKAYGADGNEGAGRNATIQLTSSGGISVSSEVLAVGGDGTSDYDGYAGGNATVTLNNTGGMASIVTNAGSDLHADGGAGGSGSSGPGGAGGSGSVNVNSAGGVVLNGHLNAWGGSGGSGNTGNGGSGGNASVYTGSNGTTQFGGIANVYGGSGGSEMSSTSGNGGNASLIMQSVGAMTLTSGAQADVFGGDAGSASYGTGGNGGNALIELTSNGDFSATGVDLLAQPGSASSSYYGSYGSAGLASIKLTSNAGSLNITNSTVYADGGESFGNPTTSSPTFIELKAAGNLVVSSSDLTVYGANSSENNNAGGALISLISTGGSILVNNSSLYSSGGEIYNVYSMASGGDGLISISAAGNVTLTNASNFSAQGGDGAEGGTGGGAVILVSAGGSLAMSSSAYLYASGGDSDYYSYSMDGSGGAGAITLVAGGPITVDGSEGSASGGYGGITRGAAAVNVIGGSSIAMSNGYFFADSNSAMGGSSSVVLAGAGAVSLLNSSLSAYNGGVIGVGGGGIALNDSHINGGGGVSLSSTGDISVVNDSTVASTSNLNITALGGLLVNNSDLYGFPDVNMTIGGNINLAQGGRIEAGSPSTINLFFSSATGNFFINGVGGITYDPSDGSGFFVMGSPAVVGGNMMVRFAQQIPTTTTVPINTLIVALTQSTKPPGSSSTKTDGDDDKEKRDVKKERSC